MKITAAPDKELICWELWPVMFSSRKSSPGSVLSKTDLQRKNSEKIRVAEISCRVLQISSASHAPIPHFFQCLTRITSSLVNRISVYSFTEGIASNSIYFSCFKALHKHHTELSCGVQTKITPSSKAKQLIKNVKQYKPMIWTRRIVVKWTQNKICKHAEYCYTGQELDENNIIRKALRTYPVGFQNCLLAMYFREYFVKPSHRRKHFIKICN